MGTVCLVAIVNYMVASRPFVRLYVQYTLHVVNILI